MRITARNLKSIIRKYSNEIPFEKFNVAYNSKLTEEGKYEKWLINNYFKPNINLKNKYSVILPPPNITGTLHLGHALTVAIEDVLVRWHRMRGFSTLWIPGSDHAGIATQVIVEKKLWHEKSKTRYDIGRDEFVKLVWEWKDEKAKFIEQQLQRLGASLDWSQVIFTMDSQQSEAVVAAFINLYEKNLIYRDNALVNWCCSLQSAISDIEVEQMEVNEPTRVNVPGYKDPIEFGMLYKFAYKICDSSDEIIVATTRPETMLGDVAVVIHPQDERYSHLHGKFVWHPFRKQPIPILFDEFVDRDFGTGVVKITPGHDRIDFEIGKKFSLPILQVINEQGIISDNCCPEIFGLKRYDARQKIIQILDEMNFYRGAESHKVILPICSRSKDIIEYLIKPQWFIKCKDMAEKASKAVKSGELIIEPTVFEQNWFNWLDNIRDWNISRQLWWGHQIPAYECWLGDDKENCKWIIAENDVIAKQKAKTALGSSDISIRRDDDVLDTWFSSALLPFSVFGWPKPREDFTKYYPLNVMETGHDILFFWVARMVMLGMELTGQLPFNKILLHGIICDKEGRKMSKSLGNVVLPENVINGITLEELDSQVKANYESGLLSESEYKRAIEGQKSMFPNGIPQCGADALRFTLCSHNIKSHFINFDVAECYTNKLFCNKIWQAVKYANIAASRLPNQQREQYKTIIAVDNLHFHSHDKMGQWILSRLSYLVTIVNKALQNSDFHVATSALKNFFYTELCDNYIEYTKPFFKTDCKTSLNLANEHCITLAQCLAVGLRCLAPFMPYITEELYSHVPFTRFININAIKFPEIEHFEELRHEDVEADINVMLKAVKTIRRILSTYKNNEKQISGIKLIYIETTNPLYQEYLKEIEILTGTHCQIVNSVQQIKEIILAADTVGSDCIVHLITNTLNVSDRNETLINFIKKEEKLNEKLLKLKNIVSQEGYLQKAPEKVQKAHKEQIKQITEELTKIKLLKDNYKRLDDS